VAVYDEKLVSRYHLLGDSDTGILYTPPLFIAFDVLLRGNRDLRRLPLCERRAVLGDLVDDATWCCRADGFPTTARRRGPIVEERGYEGMVAKDPQSRHYAGPTRSWVKVKHRHEGRVLRRRYPQRRRLRRRVGGRVGGRRAPLPRDRRVGLPCGGALSRGEDAAADVTIRRFAVDARGRVAGATATRKSATRRSRAGGYGRLAGAGCPDNAQATAMRAPIAGATSAMGSVTGHLIGPFSEHDVGGRHSLRPQAPPDVWAGFQYGSRKPRGQPIHPRWKGYRPSAPLTPPLFDGRRRGLSPWPSAALSVMPRRARREWGMVPSVGSARSTRRRTVLLVEDDTDTRILFRQALVAAQYDVVSIASAREALDMLSIIAVDIIIMDVGVRGEHLDIAAKIAAAERASQLIALTGRTPKRHGTEAVFAAYILKPVMPDDLVSAVNRVARR
jgi:CheY-like chemotaxis protein